RACVATRRAATGGAPGDRAAPPSADAEARDTAATSPWSARAPPLLPCVGGAEAERVERRHDLVFHHLADDLLLRGGVEHTERARRAFTAGRRVAAAKEAPLDVDDDAGGAIGDAPTLGARPLRRAPRQVIPAEPRVMDLVGHQRAEDALGHRIARAPLATGEERRRQRLADGGDLGHR